MQDPKSPKVPGGLRASLKIYLNPQVIAMGVLGFPYGMMYFLAIPTLQTWLKESDVPTEDVALLAFATIPYVLKFLWAPLVGIIKIPYLGRKLGVRRSWLITAHLFLMIFLVLLGFSEPAHHIGYAAGLSLTLLFFAAIQDIVVDAYRIELLGRNQKMGPGVGMLITGYRLGSVTANAGTLYLAAHFSWPLAYCVMALLVTMGIVAALLNPEPQQALKPQHFSLKTYLTPPLKDFFRRSGAWVVVFFIVFYRLGDAFINTMANSFYIEMGFSIIEIADVTKIFGILPTLVGGLLGGVLTLRLSIYQSLLFCGFIHMLSHLMYVGQSLLGYNVEWLYGLIVLENVTSGLTTAVFLLYLSKQTSPLYVATQYAFFTSLWSLSTFLSGSIKFILPLLHNNWTAFFGLSILLSLPALGVIPLLKRQPLVSPSI